MNRFVTVFCLIVIATGASAMPLQAASNWTFGALTQDFGTAGNWDNPPLFDGTDNFLVDGNDPGTSPIISTAITATKVNVGDTSTGLLTMTDGGSLTCSGQVQTGVLTNASGQSVIDVQAGSVSLGSWLFVGYGGGDAVVKLSGTSTLTETGGADLGFGEVAGPEGVTTKGSLQLSGTASVTTNGIVRAGDNKTWGSGPGAAYGEVVLTEASQLTANSFTIICGTGVGATGKYQLTGSSTEVNANPMLVANCSYSQIGTEGGNGALDITDATFHAVGEVDAGWVGLAQGTVKLTTSADSVNLATINCDRDMTIGRSSGIGLLQLYGDSRLNVAWRLYLGRETDAAGVSTGTAEFNGTSVVHVGGYTCVGWDAGTAGHLTLNDSATLNDDTIVVINPASDMTLNDSSTVNSPGSIILQGVVNLNNDSTLATLCVNTWNASSGVLNFNGGTLKATATMNATASWGSFLDPNDPYPFFTESAAPPTVKVLSGGAKIDTAGFNVKFNQPLLADTGSTGGLTKLGAGTLIMSAASTYTGSTVIKDGTLKIDRQTVTPQTLQEMYTDTPNLAGNRPPIGGYSLGQTFTVNSPIQISQLGMFDSDGDGLGEAHTVHLSQTSDGTPIAAITFAAGSDPSTSGTYQNGYRFLSLTNPVTLQSGTYTIWFEPSGGADNFGEEQTAFDGGSGTVTRVQADYGGAPGMPASWWNTASTSESAASFIYGNVGYVGSTNFLPTTTPVVMGGIADSTPTLDLQGAHQQIASLADFPDAVVTGIVTNSDPSLQAILTLSAPSGTTAYSGSISGNISLVKSGGSTQILTGALTYTGDTTVDGGVLDVSAIDTPDSTVSVTGDGMLTASSITTGTLTIGGTRVGAAPVPEPGTFVLLALAGLGALVAARRQKP
jgi:autotransporter-associated beta strand protein